MSFETQYDYPHEPPRQEKPVRTPRFPVVGLIGALLCVLVIWVHNRGQDSFLIHAARVRNAEDLRIVGWTSERELLAFHPRFSSREALLLNVETGERTRLDALTAIVCAGKEGAALYRPRLSLSPNRKWLLYAPVGSDPASSGGHRISAVSLDGTKRRDWLAVPRTGDRGASFVWSTDSTRWYRFRRSGADPFSPEMQVYAFRLDDPKAVSVRDIRAHDFRPRGAVNGKALSSDFFWGDEPPLDRPPAFRTMDMASTDALPQRVPLNLPKGTTGYFLYPAATADRILVDSWTRTPPAKPWYTRWLAGREGARGRIWHSVMEFDSNGKKLRDAGRIRSRFHERMGDTMRVMSCSPSGKRVLFRLNESLYVKEIAP